MSERNQSTMDKEKVEKKMGVAATFKMADESVLKKRVILKPRSLTKKRLSPSELLPTFSGYPKPKYKTDVDERPLPFSSKRNTNGSTIHQWSSNCNHFVTQSPFQLFPDVNRQRKIYKFVGEAVETKIDTLTGIQTMTALKVVIVSNINN